MGGAPGKSGGCLAPDDGEDARSRSRSFCCCLRTACDLAGFGRLCFFPLLACKLPSSLPRSCLPFPPSLLLSLASLSFSSPVLLGDSGRRGGRLPARSPRWLPSTGLAPLDSLPPSRDLGGKMQANSSGFVFLAPPISPVEVSFLLFPFRAAIFQTRSECFGVPLSCVLGEV